MSYFLRRCITDSSIHMAVNTTWMDINWSRSQMRSTVSDISYFKLWKHNWSYRCVHVMFLKGLYLNVFERWLSSQTDIFNLKMSFLISRLKRVIRLRTETNARISIRSDGINQMETQFWRNLGAWLQFEFIWFISNHSDSILQGIAEWKHRMKHSIKMYCIALYWECMVCWAREWVSHWSVICRVLKYSYLVLF